MGQNIEKTITSEMVVAYSQCPRKAFLLYTQEKGTPHEYIRLLEQQKERLQSKYLDALSRQNLNPQPFTLDNLKRGSDLLTQVTLKVKGVESGSIGAIIGNFKSLVTKRANQLRHTPGAKLWQRGYYDRIIRNERELNTIRQYIRDNPRRWHEDLDNVDVVIARMRLVEF